MTSSADLFSLQEIDLRRDTQRALIADIDTRLGESDAVVAAREELEDAEADLASLRSKQHDLEDQLEDLDARLNPMETKLYDGSVRNPKELSDMQREVEHLKQRRVGLDEQGLSLIEAVEVASTSVAEARQQLELAQSTWEVDQADLIADKAKAEATTQRLDAERGRWTDVIDASTLGLYERLRTGRQGRAVARVERSICQGCRIGLPSHLVQRVRSGGLLVQCPSCERILVGN